MDRVLLSDEERSAAAVPLTQLDGYLKTIIRFKLREFIHLNPCFNTAPALDMNAYPIDVRNYRRILTMEATENAVPNRYSHVPLSVQTCPHKKRAKNLRSFFRKGNCR